MEKLTENAKKTDAKCKENKFWIYKLNVNLYVIGWMNCFNIGKYIISRKNFIKKPVVVFVINESCGKMLGDNNFSKVQKLSNPTA